jgi:hypothetical protein
MLWKIEVFTAVTMKNAIVFLFNVLQLLVTALFFVTVMMEAIRSSETSVLTRAARHSIPEDGILHGCGLFETTVKMYRTARRYVLEGSTLHPYRCEDS